MRTDVQRHYEVILGEYNCEKDRIISARKLTRAEREACEEGDFD